MILKGCLILINNFICGDCDHQFVCDKLKLLMKFHEEAKADLKVTITMNGCLDFKDSDAREDEDA